MKTVKVRNRVLGDGTPKICVPITAVNMDELREQARAAAESPCDMVEWRADFFEAACEMHGTGVDDGVDAAECTGTDWLIEPLALLRSELKELPLLFTFRTKEEGGERSVSPDEYVRLNTAAAASGMADMADVELNRGEELFCSLTEKLHAEGIKVIGSFHDFEKTPSREKITGILCRMQELGADITKAAVMPQSEKDVLTLLDASIQMKQTYGDRPFITMSMGRLGAVSRAAGNLTGSAVTFATAGRASAPGQLEATLLARLLPSL